MTAPTVYFHDDAGAPVLGGRQDAFYQILRACLVDGYGAKAAAGWSIVYDDWAGSGYCTFTNANQTAVLGIKRAAGDYQPFLFLAEGMIDATTFVNARSGLTSITSPWSPSDTSTSYQRPAQQNYTIGAWCVVANENTAFVFSATSASNLTTLNINYAESIGWMIGFGVFDDARGLSADDSGNFSIIGGAIGYKSDINESVNSYADIGIGTALLARDNAYFTGIGATFVYPCTAFSYVYQAYLTADAVSKISLTPVDIYVSHNTGGDFRAYAWQRAAVPMLKSHFLLCVGNGQSEAVSVVSDFASRVLLDTLTIDSKNYLLCRAPRNAYFLISLDPSDWL